MRTSDAEPDSNPACKSAAEHAELFRAELLLSSDGLRLFASWPNGRLSMHDAASLRVVSELQRAGEPRWRMIELTPDGAGLVVEPYDKSDSVEHLELWATRSNLRRRLPVPSLCSNPVVSNHALVCHSYDKLWFWTGFTSERPKRLPGLLDADLAAVSPNDQQFAVVSNADGAMPAVARWTRQLGEPVRAYRTLEAPQGPPPSDGGASAIAVRINDAGDIAVTTLSASVHRLTADGVLSAAYLGQEEDQLVLETDGTIWTLHGHGPTAPLRWSTDGAIERFDSGPTRLSVSGLGASGDDVVAVGLHGAFRWSRGVAKFREDSWCTLETEPILP